MVLQFSQKVRSTPTVSLAEAQPRLWLIALSDNLLIARVAFDAAVQHHPRGRWQLRQGTRVFERYEPKAASPLSALPKSGGEADIMRVRV
jgi:hypothetical protein